MVTMIETQIMFAFFLLIVISATNSTNCVIRNDAMSHKYPNDDGNFTYVINFNTTTRQANFVYYISPSQTDSCPKSERIWVNDPYGLASMKYADYTNTGYDRGHLVAKADYGCSTYFMTNAVPMLPPFNRDGGGWHKIEIDIRKKYPQQLVFKGCEYTDESIAVKSGKLYIPSGCYWVVCGGTANIGIPNTIQCEIKDYGYLWQNGTHESKLPYWVDCNDGDGDGNGALGEPAIIVISIMLAFALFVGLLASVVVIVISVHQIRSRCIKKQTVRDEYTSL